MFQNYFFDPQMNAKMDVVNLKKGRTTQKIFKVKAMLACKI